MEENDCKLILFLLIVGAACAAGLLLAGCTSSDQSAQNAPDGQWGQHGPPGNGSGGFGPGGNMTDEQRQQMMQAAISACDGLGEGDSCTMQGPRSNMNGTCQLRNSTLSCGMSGGPGGVP